MEPLMKEMTTGLITMLSNETKEYKPSSVLDIMNHTRRQLFKNVDGGYHYYTYNDRKRACYSISITYKNAIWDLRRYFQVRWLYVNNLEFEVGYLVHEIIHRYQMVLELYQMAERRFLPHQNENFAWSSYMLYMYVNILEQCKVIMHLCNMLHELEAKYRKIKGKKVGVFDDYPEENGTSIKTGRPKGSDFLAKDRYDLLLFEREQRRKKKRLAKERKKQRSELLKFGNQLLKL
nr:uncharacterized protein LOC117994945 [Maniola hyperantus]